MKNRSLSIVFFLIFVFSSFKKNSLPINPNLAGQWQWKYSIGGVAVQKIVPENGRKRVLSFYADSLFQLLKMAIPLLVEPYR